MSKIFLYLGATLVLLFLFPIIYIDIVCLLALLYKFFNWCCETPWYWYSTFGGGALFLLIGTVLTIKKTN